MNHNNNIIYFPSTNNERPCLHCEISEAILSYQDEFGAVSDEAILGALTMVMGELMLSLGESITFQQIRELIEDRISRIKSGEVT